jgi:2-oxoisovalerate dehydrogenase E1 component
MSMTVEPVSSPSQSSQQRRNGVVSPTWDMPVGLSPERIKEAYELMLTSRLLDKKMLILLKQGKSFFHIGAAGHEAVQMAGAFALTAKRDWAYPYYRDQALAVGLGMTAKEIFLSFLAKKDDPNSGGRQMPQHYGHKELNIPSQSSSTGMQYLQSVGCAFASKRRFHQENGQTATPDYEVTVVGSGEGTTSQGDFHEALNWSAREKAPVIFLVENNGYAISVPIRDQTAGGKVANLGQGYKGLDVIEVDGCDFAASYVAFQNAIKRARTGNGPTLIEANVVRLLPHSSSDDQRKYRPAQELADDLARDPIPALKAWLIERNFATAEELDEMEVAVKKSIDADAEWAEAQDMPERDTAQKWVLSEEPEPELVAPTVDADGTGTVLVDAINRALDEELSHNPQMLVFGEDVAGGKGGVFTATRHLTEKHGKDRVYNSPLAESSIVGVSIGLATRGYKPVPEIQFGDYIWTAMMQIRNEMSTLRYRSNNTFTCPMVLRVPVGGYIHGALCHSQNIEAIFAHIPGIKIALPSNALDAYGLLKSAIRCNDPVLFLEHKNLYRQNFAKRVLPSDTDWVLPFGKGNVCREGEDLTIITYGAMVNRAMQTASKLADEDIDVEVIDLRTINPVDWDLIMSSAKKTGKVLVLHEDTRFMGYGAELAAEISERCFEDLDGPVTRLAGKDTPIPFNWDLEEEILPQGDDVVNAARKLAAY